MTEKFDLPEILLVADQPVQDSIKQTLLEAYGAGAKAVLDARIHAVAEKAAALQVIRERHAENFKGKPIDGVLVDTEKGSSGLAISIREAFKKRKEEPPYIAAYSEELAPDAFSTMNNIVDMLISTVGPQHLQELLAEFIVNVRKHKAKNNSEQGASPLPAESDEDNPDQDPEAFDALVDDLEHDPDFFRGNVDDDGFNFAQGGAPDVTQEDEPVEDDESSSESSSDFHFSAPANDSDKDESHSEPKMREIVAESDLLPEGKLFDLRETTGEVVAVLDLDGTLSKGFTMKAFVNHLAGSEEFRKLVKELDSDQQELNAHYLRKLKEAFLRWGKGEYQGTYEQFIRQTSIDYVKMLSGLKRVDVMKIGNRWSAEYAAKNPFHDHAKALIRLLKDLGIVPTLVTGTPQEALAGIRDALGIEERCHGLEAWVDAEGRYDREKEEKPRFLTGLENGKDGLTKKLQFVDSFKKPKPEVRRHTLIFANGDTQADQPLFTKVRRDGGLAVHFHKSDDRTADEDLVKLIKAYSQDIEDRAFLILEERWGQFARVEAIVERLQAVCQFEANRERISDETRAKLDALLKDRTSIGKYFEAQELETA